jgi:hypothetical protein
MELESSYRIHKSPTEALSNTLDLSASRSTFTLEDHVLSAVRDY